MKVLVHSLHPVSSEKKLLNALHSVVGSPDIIISSSLAQLIHQLLIVPKELFVVILVVHSDEEMDELASILDLFDDVPIILILPDQHDSTISKGHKLHPRFLTCADDNDFDDVAQVVEKIALVMNSGQVDGSQYQDQSNNHLKQLA